jgi:hypothetical protein
MDTAQGMPVDVDVGVVGDGDVAVGAAKILKSSPGRLVPTRVSNPSPSRATDFFEPGFQHVARARRALKGPGYAYKAG